MRERKLTLWDTITNTHTEVVDNAEKLREGSTTLPSAALLLKLRDDEETFRWLLQNVIAELVGKVNFERKAKSKKISEFVSISHEAFALLFLENYREVVEERAEMPKVERKKDNAERTQRQRVNIREMEEVLEETEVGAMKASKDMRICLKWYETIDERTQLEKRALR